MIRYCDDKDYNKINELLKEFNYKLDFNNDFIRVLVYDDITIKGVLVYYLIYDRIEIEYIIVDNKFRHKGIATKLLNFMETNNKNISNITLEVRESNSIAIEFYLKNGFVKCAKRKNYYGDEDGILMIKKSGE